MQKLFTEHIPLPLADKIDDLAVRLQRSRKWIVDEAVTSWVDQHEERHRLTLEALADVDAGRLADQTSVEAGPKAEEQTLLCDAHSDEDGLDGQSS